MANSDTATNPNASLQNILDTWQANSGNLNQGAMGNLLADLGINAGQQAATSPYNAVNNTVAGGLGNAATGLAGYLTTGSGTPLGQTPNWQTVQNQVEQTYDQSADLNNAQNIAAQQQALAASMGASGLTGSTFNESGNVGLQNLSALLGAQANEQGLAAGLQEGQSLRNESTQDYLSGLGALGSIGQTAFNQINPTTASNILSQAGGAFGGQAGTNASNASASDSLWGDIGSGLMGMFHLGGGL